METKSPRIKKVLVIRIPAEGGQLIDRSEFLMDETTIAAAKAGVQNYFRILDAANSLAMKGKTAADHYPQIMHCHVPSEEQSEDNVEVWDIYIREDFWYSMDAVLLERIYIKVVR